jgi:hypothetical protein
LLNPSVVEIGVVRKIRASKRSTPKPQLTRKYLNWQCQTNSCVLAKDCEKQR